MDIIKMILNWFRPQPEEPKTAHEQLYNTLQDCCPECQHSPAYFYTGPTGGASVNIFCGFCGQGYNIAPIIGWAERIHKDTTYIHRLED
jgi:hypothetical protein